MLTVALTGGIASGKSTVARYFAELGIAIIDADKIARGLIKNDSFVFSQIVDYFGQSILTDNQVNRVRLRNIIFFDSVARVWLEQLLHPLIYKKIQSSLKIVKSIYCLVVIPLLFEERTISLLKKKPDLGSSIELNRILLVTTTKELQFQRAKERDQLEKKQIDAIFSVQMPLSESMYKADDIIYNQTSLDDLRESVQCFHQMYLSFAYTKNISLEQSLFLRYYLCLK